MPSINRRAAGAALLFVLSGAFATAQEIAGTYDQSGGADDPEGADEVRRVIAERSGEAYMFTFLEGDDGARYECRAVEAEEGDYFCTSGSRTDLLLTVHDSSLEIDEYGRTIEAHPVASESGAGYALFRGYSDERTMVEALLTQPGDSFSMRFSLWRRFFTRTSAAGPGGGFEVDDSGTPLTLRFDGDRLDVSGQGPTTLSLMRVDYAQSAREMSRSGSSDRSAPADARFAADQLRGSLDDAFQQWYGIGAPVSAARRAAQLRVRDRLALELAEERFISLSPEGSRIVSHADRGRSLTVHRSRDGEVVAVAELEEPLIDAPYTFRWAPTGEAALFGHDYFQRLEESDLYLLDVDEASVRNLTPDGYRGDTFSAPDDAPNDITPAWLSGQRAIFQRLGSAAGPQLLSYDLESGEITRAVALPMESVGVIMLQLVPRIGELLASFYGVNDADPKNGVWAAAPGAKSLTQIKLPSEGYQPVTLTEASFHGRYLLLLPRFFFSEYGDVSAQPYIFDRETRQIIDIVSADGGERSLLGATFSPDGSKVLYLYRELEEERDVLAVRDLTADARPHVLIEDLPGAGAPRYPLYGPLGIYWAANDRVMITTHGNRRATLFTLR